MTRVYITPNIKGLFLMNKYAAQAKVWKHFLTKKIKSVKSKLQFKFLLRFLDLGFKFETICN